MKLDQKERFFALGICILVSLFTLLDVYEDLKEGNALSHILTEACSILIIFGLGIYIWRGSIKERIHLRKNLASALKESQAWRDETKNLREGLSKIIESEFKSWGLTPAESEVAWLLLKGLSQKKIAEIRQTSEKTIRQQSVTIYRKADVSNRAELSAIFVEDLL